MNTFSICIMNYLRELVRNRRRSHAAKVDGATTLNNVFGDQLHDYDFQMWLVEAFMSC